MGDRVLRIYRRYGPTATIFFVLYNQYWRWGEVCSSDYGGLNIAGEVNFMY
jgi:hypothetical protein